MSDRHANDNPAAAAAQREHLELRSLLDQTHFLLRRAQQVIERTGDRRRPGSRDEG